MKLNYYFTALLCIASCNVFSQQSCESLELPYSQDFEATQGSILPECLFSAYSSFASTEVFEIGNETVPGFTNNVAQYNTASPLVSDQSANVASRLVIGNFVLTTGQAYVLSGKFGKSQPGENAMVGIYIQAIFGGNTALVEQALPDSNFEFVQEFTVSVSGTYSILFTVNAASNSGFVYVDDIKLEEASQMNVKDNSLESLSFYPNPVKDKLNITYKDAIESVKLYNISGQLILEEQHETSQVFLDLENLASGVYFLNVSSGGEQKQVKILKE